MKTNEYSREERKKPKEKQSIVSFAYTTQFIYNQLIILMIWFYEKNYQSNVYDISIESNDLFVFSKIK